MDFKSVTKEIESLRDKVLYFTKHKYSNGFWRETILKRLIKRHLPQPYEIGQGFVITEKGCSTEIDIIIYDNTKPILHKEEGFIITSIDSVIGIIEVKTRTYKESLKNLKHNIELFNSSLYSINKKVVTPNRFHAYFSYDSYKNHKKLPVTNLQFLCVGNSTFIKYWESWYNKQHNSWHVYKLEKTAYGYFISSIIDYLESKSMDFPFQNTLFFPKEDLEKHCIEKIQRDT